MLEDREAAGKEVSLGDADALVFVTELSEKAGFDIALEIFGLDVNISDQSTTFKERITHTVCSY
jgi:hypothetical protein